MALVKQFRRGTTADHSSFVGAVGEITNDTDLNVVVVHDGSTSGGFPMLGAGNNLSDLDDSDTALTNLGVTATTAELNKLDGCTATTAELNKLDGCTATTAELNKLDGCTATTAELNKLDGLTGNIATSGNDGPLYGGYVDGDDGSELTPFPSSFSASRTAEGRYTITHSFGHTNYTVVTSPVTTGRIVRAAGFANNDFGVITTDTDGTDADGFFTFILIDFS